jgi:hypothetical protein
MGRLRLKQILAVCIKTEDTAHKKEKRKDSGKKRRGEFLSTALEVYLQSF